MHPNAFRCPAVSVTAAVVGGATLLAVAYYFWSRPKKSCKPSECSSANRSESLESSEESGGDGRASAGMDTQENMNSFDNENVGGIWKRKEWFMEQMKMGEDDETTVEQMAKANETESVLRGLRDAYKSIGRIQEYLTTDMHTSTVTAPPEIERLLEKEEEISMLKKRVEQLEQELWDLRKKVQPCDPSSEEISSEVETTFKSGEFSDEENRVLCQFVCSRLERAERLEAMGLKGLKEWEKFKQLNRKPQSLCNQWKTICKDPGQIRSFGMSTEASEMLVDTIVKTERKNGKSEKKANKNKTVKPAPKDKKKAAKKPPKDNVSKTSSFSGGSSGSASSRCGSGGAPFGSMITLCLTILCIFSGIASAAPSSSSSLLSQFATVSKYLGDISPITLKLDGLLKLKGDLNTLIGAHRGSSETTQINFMTKTKIAWKRLATVPEALTPEMFFAPMVNIEQQKTETLAEKRGLGPPMENKNTLIIVGSNDRIIRNRKKSKDSSTRTGQSTKTSQSTRTCQSTKTVPVPSMKAAPSTKTSRPAEELGTARDVTVETDAKSARTAASISEKRVSSGTESNSDDSLLNVNHDFNEDAPVDKTPSENSLLLSPSENSLSKSSLDVDRDLEAGSVSDSSSNHGSFNCGGEPCRHAHTYEEDRKLYRKKTPKVC
ncbi:unnamed protein product [Caenorhabditis brenneri]